MVLGVLWRSKSNDFASYICQKSGFLAICFQDAPKTPPRRSKTVERRLQGSPRHLKDAPRHLKTPPDSSKMAQAAPKTPHRFPREVPRSPKTSPKRLKTPPRTPQDPAKTFPRQPKTLERRPNTLPRSTKTRPKGLQRFATETLKDTRKEENDVFVQQTRRWPFSLPNYTKHRPRKETNCRHFTLHKTMTHTISRAKR